jgi:hypothetical protein
MKLKCAHLANAIQVGDKLEKFFSNTEGNGKLAYELTLENNILHIQRKDKPQYKAFTTIFNVIGGEFEDNKAAVGSDAGNKTKSIKTA